MRRGTWYGGFVENSFELCRKTVCVCVLMNLYGFVHVYMCVSVCVCVCVCLSQCVMSSFQPCSIPSHIPWVDSVPSKNKEIMLLLAGIFVEHPP